MAVRGICEPEAEDLGVFLGLLEAVSGILVDRLCFDDGDREVRAIPQKIIEAFLGTANGPVARDDDTTVGEGPLFVYAIVVPAGGVQFRQDVLATGVGFRERGHQR